VPINYVGSADRVDATEIEGDIAGRDAVVRFIRGGKTLAVASIYRDRESLESEVGLERASRSG
jgi:hypothetical protein